MAKNEIVSFEHSSKDGPPAEELERAGKAILVLIDRVAQTTEARAGAAKVSHRNQSRLALVPLISVRRKLLDQPRQFDLG